MTLLEYYLNPGTAGINAGATFTALGATQWKYHFVSGRVTGTGSSTVNTETSISFVNSLNTGPNSNISAQTTSTSTAVGSQQYPAGGSNAYFSPMIGNRLEEITGYIQNAASVSGNYILFAIEIDLDGDFDE